ncbi:hypothetical protein HYALB_00013762 [Hymenoscyphus albidus]|uniref:Uncharacterized protein n=1 Tax=Hymenoscyphus albidus TaxID=595503 RepID=A0A9N9LVQ7_9HELO|nr:hypothetical protein HYALB_00013762 [Hymenoscyphus albidus]
MPIALVQPAITVDTMQNQRMYLCHLLTTIRRRNKATELLLVGMAKMQIDWPISSHFMAIEYAAGSRSFLKAPNPENEDAVVKAQNKKKSTFSKWVSHITYESMLNLEPYQANNNPVIIPTDAVNHKLSRVNKNQSYQRLNPHHPVSSDPKTCNEAHVVETTWNFDNLVFDERRR